MTKQTDIQNYFDQCVYFRSTLATSKGATCILKQSLQKANFKSTTLLTHYCPHKTLLVACDASPHGVGTVLSHCNAYGTEQPIAFISRFLSWAEKGYAQLDKEAVATVLGVTKFCQYLLGRQFITS